MMVHSMPDTVLSARDAGVMSDMSALLIDTSKFYYKVNIEKVERDTASMEVP